VTTWPRTHLGKVDGSEAQELEVGRPSLRSRVPSGIHFDIESPMAYIKRTLRRKYENVRTPPHLKLDRETLVA